MAAALAAPKLAIRLTAQSHAAASAMRRRNGRPRNTCARPSPTTAIYHEEIATITYEPGTPRLIPEPCGSRATVQGDALSASAVSFEARYARTSG